jgi:hypothetical protein
MVSHLIGFGVRQNCGAGVGGVIRVGDTPSHSSGTRHDPSQPKDRLAKLTRWVTFLRNRDVRVTLTVNEGIIAIQRAKGISVLGEKNLCSPRHNHAIHARMQVGAGLFCVDPAIIRANALTNSDHLPALVHLVRQTFL